LEALCFTFFFFFGGTGLWTQDFMLAWQALVQLFHSASPVRTSVNVIIFPWYNNNMIIWKWKKKVLNWIFTEKRTFDNCKAIDLILRIRCCNESVLFCVCVWDAWYQIHGLAYVRQVFLHSATCPRPNFLICSCTLLIC
jgi:hypothetical protein